MDSAWSAYVRNRRGRGGFAPLELDRAEHLVVPVDLAPLALDEFDDEVGARAPELAARSISRVPSSSVASLAETYAAKTPRALEIAPKVGCDVVTSNRKPG